MFFRAGVLGQMEEFRDDRLGKIVSWMQAWIRGYLARKDYKKIQEQRIALQVVQRNLRKYLQLRTWPWYKLWQKVKPLLNVSRVEDEIAVSISEHYLHFQPSENIGDNTTRMVQCYGVCYFFHENLHNLESWNLFQEYTMHIQTCPNSTPLPC